MSLIGDKWLLGWLLAVLMLAMATWIALEFHAAAEGISDICGDGFKPPPEGPVSPKKLLALRETEGVGSGSLSGVRLHWVNDAWNTNCVVVQQRPSAYAAADTWTTVTTINDPTVNEYLHRDVAPRGEICYRAYAANEMGRSDYSNRVCLLLDPPPQIAANPAATVVLPTSSGNAAGMDQNGQSSRSNIWVLAVIAVGLVVAAGLMFGRFWPRAQSSS